MTTVYSTPKGSSLGVRLAVSCAVSVLAACGQSGSTSITAASNAETDNTLADAPPPATALPLASGPAPASRAAPVASALPYAPRVPLGRVPQGERYAYLNQAYQFSRSLADSPPDYSYDYQGERPWVWESPDGDYRVAERLPTGVRYFYYARGASTPYLVQDPQYSYAYSQGYLAAVYGPGGQLLPPDVQARQAQEAGAYLAWAAGLYAAARHEQHVAVSQERWNAERQDVYADQARWNADQQRNAEWAAYSQAHQDDQAHWAAQRYVRAAEAARFAQAVNDQTALVHAQAAAVDARAIAQSRGERLPGPQPGGAFAGRDHQGAPPAAPGPVPAGPMNQARVQQSPVQQGPVQQSPVQQAPMQHGAFEQGRGQGRQAPVQEGRGPVGPAAAPGYGAAGSFAAEHAQAVSRQAPTPLPARAPVQARDQAANQSRLAAEAPRQAERQSAVAAANQARAQHEAQAAASRQAQANETAQRAAAERGAADAHRQAAEQAAAEAHQHAAQAAEAHNAAPAQAQVQAHRQTPPPPPHPAPPPGRPKPDEPHP